MMKNYKILFCDLDGTLIETMSGETFPKGIWDMKFKFDVLDAITKLNPEFVFIVSNQGGIENGFVNPKSFIMKENYIVQSIRDYCNIKCDAKICTSNDVNDVYRKPNTRMLFDFFYRPCCDGITKDQCLMIGDASGKKGQYSDTDKKTAENFGIDYMDVDDFVTEIVEN